MGSHLCGKRTSQKLLQLDKILPHYWKGNFLLYVTRCSLLKIFLLTFDYQFPFLDSLQFLTVGEENLVFQQFTTYLISSIISLLSPLKWKFPGKEGPGLGSWNQRSGIGNWLLECMKFVLLYWFPFSILENILSPTFIVNSGSWFSKKALLDVRRFRVKADFSLYPYKPCTLTALSEDGAKLS